jgi:enoyl-CoA hydratase/carnithine racemase
MKGAQAAEVSAQMEAEAAHFARMLTAPEAKEAFTAFFEKRKPDFSRFN